MSQREKKRQTIILCGSLMMYKRYLEVDLFLEIALSCLPQSLRDARKFVSSVFEQSVNRYHY